MPRRPYSSPAPVVTPRPNWIQASGEDGGHDLAGPGTQGGSNTDLARALRHSLKCFARKIALSSICSNAATMDEVTRMSHHGLGEFEHFVLLSILRLGEDVYGVPIAEEIMERTGRTVSRTAVYVTIRRLEKKGLITSWMGGPTPERGGKARRYIELAPAGLEALRESRIAIDEMWRGVPIPEAQ